MKNTQYIGDGVYVSLNEYGQAILTTGHHEPRLAQNHIVLEPEVLAAFMQWLDARSKEMLAEKANLDQITESKIV